MSSAVYRYAGTFTEIGGIAEGDYALKKFGQSITLSDDLAHDVILGGGAIVPEAAWDAIGFTEQELSIYSDVYTHADALPAFLAKKKQALMAYHDLRVGLEAGAVTLSVVAPVSHPPLQS